MAKTKAKAQTKYIFVTGGVMSGLGKGITAASIGKILSARGFSVTMCKCDPYLNTDAGTLNPAEHGEVFVTADGGETDLDLGHYERFINRSLDRNSSIISGQIFARVIADERAGKYLGKTVQIIPHVTAEIHRRITKAAQGFDICIVEIGGTVGDYEAMAFVEAIRQMRQLVGEDNVLYAHLVYVPYLATSKEMKTKPAQNSVRDLREAGIKTDILCVRSDEPLGEDAYQKMSLFCDVGREGIVALPTARSVYEIPLRMERAGLGDYIAAKLKLPKRKSKLDDWEHLVKRIVARKKPVNIAVVAKYMSNIDTYKSVFEALKSAGWHHDREVEISWIDAEKLEFEQSAIEGFDGILVPGGFGNRGVEGKIKAVEFARTQQVPFLGLCLGMQIAVIEFARNVAGLKDANSAEFAPEGLHRVIDIMPDQIDVDLGGSMRLGNYPARLNPKSRAALAYGTKTIVERHRHRYEFNNDYREQLTKLGLVIAATSPDSKLVEIVELTNHPFFVASQFHPEFNSKPEQSHPLFRDFIGSAMRNTKEVLGSQQEAQAKLQLS